MFHIRLDEGLSLQLLEARHAVELYALIDANREHLGRWFPWVQETTDPQDTRAFIEGGLARFARGDGFEPAGIRENGRLVGCLGLHYVHRPVGKTEIGYWLARDAQGRGIVSRTIGGLLPYLFREMDLHRVEIRADPMNDRSRAVPERLGFTEEGVLRAVAWDRGQRYDHVIYSLLRPEWEARQDDPATLRASVGGRG